MNFSKTAIRMITRANRFHFLIAGFIGIALVFVLSSFNVWGDEWFENMLYIAFLSCIALSSVRIMIKMKPENIDAKRFGYGFFGGLFLIGIGNILHICGVDIIRNIASIALIVPVTLIFIAAWNGANKKKEA